MGRHFKMTRKISSQPLFRFSGSFLMAVFLLLGGLNTALCQLVPDNFGNNATNVKWQKVETAHFKIVFATREAAIVPVIASNAERIFAEYQRRMGMAPTGKIALFYNGPGELVSGIRAQNMDDEYSIWRGNPSKVHPVPGLEGQQKSLRLEIAYAFQENLEVFFLDYWYYLFSRPSQSPWSDGLTSFLAQPVQTAEDIAVMRNYWYDRSYNITEPSLGDQLNTILGRSQIHFFREVLPEDSLQEMYTFQQKLFGLFPYYDFNTAFERAYGLSYEDFSARWQSVLYSRFMAQQHKRFTARQPLLPQQHILEYEAARMHPVKNVAASLSYPDDGIMVQQLRVGSPEIRESQLIEEGYFSSSMDWHPQDEILAYAKWAYNNRKGQYISTLRTWNKDTGEIKVIASDKNALAPTFSPGGDSLAFVEEATTQAAIWLQELETGRRRKLYSFEQPVSITHMNFHPNEDRLLISYHQDGVYKAGLLDVATKTFTALALQAQIPLNIQWGSDGRKVYFNSPARQVPNIYRADLSGNELTNIRRVTSGYFGAELMDVARLGKHGKSVSVLAKVDRNKVFGFRADTNLSAASIPKVVPLKKPGNDSTVNATFASANDEPTGEPYHPFSDISWEKPAVIPYYLNPDDFGFGAYLKLLDPMQIHTFDYRGTVSAANPFQSFFYSSYENNSFRPTLELSYHHLPSSSGFFGKSRKVRTIDVIALESLWRLTGLSHDYNDWYFGLTLRHLAFDYFSTGTLRSHHPDVFFNNTKTRQTDLKATLAWRKLKPSRHTLIHPASGTGLRLSVTGSDNVLGSQTQYARLNLDGYKVIPAWGKHRIYIYANGVMDIGEPAGRDYLSLADNGNFQLPEENFLGSINPDYDRFVRGYDTSLLGDRFLFGKFEYRIPFQFDTNQKLLGIIPPARTVFALFSDGGIMGDARLSENIRRTKYRYSTGIEMKRVFSIGGSFKITYELGVGQPLTEAFGPRPYFNIRSALPF